MSRQYPRTHEQLLRIWSEEEIAERRQRTREKVLEAIEPWLFKIVFYYGFSKGAHFEKQEGFGTGFDPITHDILVDTLTSFLSEVGSPTSSQQPDPDTHLEMAYEDRVSGWND